jgi:hypothetical protein
VLPWFSGKVGILGILFQILILRNHKNQEKDQVLLRIKRKKAFTSN